MPKDKKTETEKSAEEKEEKKAKEKLFETAVVQIPWVMQAAGYSAVFDRVAGVVKKVYKGCLVIHAFWTKRNKRKAMKSITLPMDDPRQNDDHHLDHASLGYVPDDGQVALEMAWRAPSGKVLGLGKGPMAGGEHLGYNYRVGDRVVVKRNAKGQEMTVNSQTFYVYDVRDILGYIVEKKD